MFMYKYFEVVYLFKYSVLYQRANKTESKEYRFLWQIG